MAWSSPGRPSRERSERSWRRATVVISVGAHVAAALGAIAYSFWHVEELQPPRVTVTFVSAASLPPPPPPPPPPLAGGGGAPKRRNLVRPKLETVNVPEVKPPSVELPLKAPPIEPVHDAPAPDNHSTTGGAGSGSGSEAGVKGGVVGGVKGGVVGGVVGGAVGAPAPKFLPPQMGAQRKLSGADPDFPPVLRRPGATFLVMAKICVGGAGGVDSVTLMKRAEPTLDTNVIAAVKGWRFQPMTANGTPVPFCYFGRFEFKSD